LKKKKQSLLWEVSFPDHNNYAYVFGTMHVKSRRVFSAFDQITPHIDKCDSFCLEIDIEVSKDAALQALMMLPPSNSLMHLLSKKEYERLNKILSNLKGPNIEQLIYIRPMNIISLISSLIMIEDESMILDARLYEYAKGQEKRTFGIESKEEHIIILNSLGLDRELKHLKEIIKHFGPFRKSHHKMMSYYLNGQIDKLYLNGKKSLGAWRKTLLKDRNVKMASRLKQLTATESIFCAVGAGHLSGKHGILRLLKLEGAKLSPIKLFFT